MSKPEFLRHSGWITPSNFVFPICIIGCGAVGSNLALSLARMGATEFCLYDFDLVEPHNLPNQAFYTEHIGQPKVDALEDLLKRFNPDIVVKKFNDRFTAEHAEDLGASVVCLAVDSLNARKEIAELCRLHSAPVLMTDVRLGFDYGEAFCFNAFNESYNRWLATIVDDSLAEESPCNRRICTTLVSIVVSYVCHMICNFHVTPEAKIPLKRMFYLASTLETRECT